MNNREVQLKVRCCSMKQNPIEHQINPCNMTKSRELFESTIEIISLQTVTSDFYKTLEKVSIKLPTDFLQDLQ